MKKDELGLLEQAGYSKKAIELYNGKINVGAMETSDVVLVHTGPCGDTIKLYLKISRDNVIEDAKFQYLGCTASAMSGSILTQIIKSNTLLDASKISEDDVLKELGGLPREKCHCVKLAVTALHKTLLKYEEIKKRTQQKAVDWTGDQ